MSSATSIHVLTIEVSTQVEYMHALLKLLPNLNFTVTIDFFFVYRLTKSKVTHVEMDVFMTYLE